MKNKLLFAPLLLIPAVAFVLGLTNAGERMFSWTMAPAQGDYITARLKSYNLGKYLERCQLNRPEVLNAVKTALDSGRYYRESTRDQRGRPTIATVSVNPDYQMRIVTNRDETCEACKGEGSRAIPFGNFTSGISAGLSCPACGGDGKLERQTTEKYFVLSPEDFENPEEARRIIASKDFEGAPRDAKKWVDRLASQNPAERLAACEWLDKNYVRIGGQFTAIDPMLRKARYHETNERRRVMVWQFWAGRGMRDERKKAYYRIYANSRTGKITEKGFYSE